MKPAICKKALAFSVIGVVVLGIAGTAFVGWYYSELLRTEALEIRPTLPEPDLELVALRGDRVILRPKDVKDQSGRWTKEGIWGLEGPFGYAQIGNVISINEHQVTRKLISTTGTLEENQDVSLESYAFTGDPLSAVGIPFEETSFTSPIGELDAWFVPGTDTAIAVFIHGRNANREESLRLLPTLVGHGYPILVISYRNDVGAPVSASGFYDYGETEWEDLHHAAVHAIELGFDELILVGYSMGGAIATNFLYESPLAPHVRGLVLDSPVLSFGAIVDHGAKLRGIPSFVTKLGKGFAGLRFGIDWAGRDYLDRTDELSTPILLFHGDDDKMVPIENSEALAIARPDIVTYVPVPGATHVRSWNVNPEAYEEKVLTFMRNIDNR